jgi:ribosome-binding protein aMBF1 (putative translation factor)
MAVYQACDCCGRPTPIFRLAGVILDGHMAQVCPRCVATEKDRIELPFAPRQDQGAIQPSTSRDIW